MPVFNSGAYLAPAVDSILGQTLPELELIAVDDGSNDGSAVVLEQYARKDSRVKVISQTNKGQGAARNAALPHATGKYVYYMDSDDLLEPFALEECFTKAEKDKLDILMFDGDVLYEKGCSGNFRYDRSSLLEANKTVTGRQMLKTELEKMCFIVSPCLMLIRRELLESKFSGFPEGIIHEDNILALKMLLEAERVEYITSKYFIRRVRSNSTVTSSFSLRNIKGYAEVGRTALEWKRERSEWSELIDEFLNKTLNSVVWLGRKMSMVDKFQAISILRSNGIAGYVSLRRWIRFIL